MAQDWGNLCTEDAAQAIMLAALAEQADKIHIARDSDGATIYFLLGPEMRIFGRLPLGTDQSICDFFMQLAGIETWRSEAASGYGLYVLGGMDISLVVNAMRGTQGYDVIVIPEIFHR